MTTVVFIHSAGLQGPGEGSSALLQGLRSALGPEWTLEAPAMPQPDNPDAEAWMVACQSAISDIGDDFVLAGHSLGGSTILQALARFGPPASLKGVVTLASPFWGAPGWDYQSYALPADAAAKLAALPRLIMLWGTQDDVVADDHLDRYRALLPNAETGRLPGIDHEAADAASHLVKAIVDITAS